MSMTVEQAEAAYEEALLRRAQQHRYVAEAQREAASRAAILPSVELEIARARANLELAQGRDRVGIKWPSGEDRVAVLRETERALRAARHPDLALADPTLEHPYLDDGFDGTCMVGQLRSAAYGKPRDEHEPDCF